MYLTDAMLCLIIQRGDSDEPIINNLKLFINNYFN